MAKLTKNYHEEHNENFKRLYYKTDKEKINEILDRLPEKYIESLITVWREKNHSHRRLCEIGNSVMVRYDGYEFYASWNNLTKRLPYLKKRKEFLTLYRDMSFEDAYKIVYGGKGNDYKNC